MEKESPRLQTELQIRSPRLAGLQGNAAGQQIPDDYFDQLEARVFQKIEEQGHAPATATSQGDRPTRTGFRILRSPRLAVAAAAVLSLAIAATWFFGAQPAADPAVPENYRELAAALSPEDAATYIAGNIHEFETAALENYAAASSAAETATEPRAKQPLPAEALPAAQLELILQDLSEEELESIL